MPLPHKDVTICYILGKKKIDIKFLYHILCFIYFSDFSV